MQRRREGNILQGSALPATENLSEVSREIASITSPADELLRPLHDLYKLELMEIAKQKLELEAKQEKISEADNEYERKQRELEEWKRVVEWRPHVASLADRSKKWKEIELVNWLKQDKFLKATTVGLNEKLTQEEARAREVVSRKNEQTEEIESVYGEILKLKSKLKNLKAQNSNLSHKVKQLKTTFSDQQRQLKDISGNILNMAMTEKQKRERILELRQRFRALSGEFQECYTKFQEEKSETKKFKAAIVTLENEIAKKKAQLEWADEEIYSSYESQQLSRLYNSTYMDEFIKTYGGELPLMEDKSIQRIKECFHAAQKALFQAHFHRQIQLNFVESTTNLAKNGSRTEGDQPQPDSSGLGQHTSSWNRNHTTRSEALRPAGSPNDSPPSPGTTDSSPIPSPVEEIDGSSNSNEH